MMGFPGGSGSKESAYNVGDLGSIPGFGTLGVFNAFSTRNIFNLHHGQYITPWSVEEYLLAVEEYLYFKEKLLFYKLDYS